MGAVAVDGEMRGGDFATARARRMTPDEIAFAASEARKGRSTQVIANMLRRCIEDVRTALAENPAAPQALPALVATPRLSGNAIPPRAYRMASEAAAKHGVSLAEAFATKKTKRHAAVRYEVYHRLYATGDYSFPQIARWFDVDHTSVRLGYLANHDAPQDSPDLKAWKQLGRRGKTKSVDRKEQPENRRFLSCANSPSSNP